MAFATIRFAVVVLSLSISPAVRGGTAAIEYNRDVRPILTEHCFACHGTDEEGRAAGLRLDVREEAIDFGAIVDGDAESSEMVARIFETDADIIMPPPRHHKPLDDQQKETLVRWINQGATYQRHWSLEPPAGTDPPPARDPAWDDNPIDGFADAKLAELGLGPAPAAESNELFRRLHLDITGLPPEPSDVAAFAVDYAADADAAVGAWVERLMERPQWGEHRARYWLDAARYADTHGAHFDNYREMWPYRDWVIRSFNRNQPFDDFYVEQLAGDLLPDPTDDQRIATGFLRCNVTTNEGGTIDDENLANYAADRVQTFGWVFLGLTTNCAQCHDHKFDEFSARDYYSLAAYFRNLDAPAKDQNHKSGGGPTMRVPDAGSAQRLETIRGEIDTLNRQIDAANPEAIERFDAWWDELAGRGSDAVAQTLAAAELPSPRFAAALGTSDHPLIADTLSDDQRSSLSSAVQDTKAFDDAGVRHLRTVADQPALRFPIDAIPGDRPWTVSFWIRPQGNWEDGTLLTGLAPGDGDVKRWEVEMNRRSLVLKLYDAQTKPRLIVRSEGAVIDESKWSHVTWVMDGSRTAAGVTLFADGTPQVLDVRQNDFHDGVERTDNGDRVEVGNRFNGSGTYISMFGLRIDDVALAADQVQVLARSIPALHSAGEAIAVRTDDAEPSDAEPAESVEAAEPRSPPIALRDYYVDLIDPTSSPLRRRRAELLTEEKRLISRSPMTHVAVEMNREPETAILMRGQYDMPGDVVPAAPPAALHDLPADAPNNRLGLARWVVDPANPLTARVTVNRFWQEVFGTGIVPTAEDFGTTGMPPSHPELLDRLTVDFVESGWDVRKLFRTIFTSRTYRQTAAATARKVEVDPNNRWLSRGPRFRMDAEMIRDTALASAGMLSDEMFGPGVRPYQPDMIWEIVGLPGGDTRQYVRDEGDSLYRRTVYNFWKRQAPPPNMETFGAPNRETCVITRERTNTPLQALVTLNDEQFVEAARGLAQETWRVEPDDRIDSIARRLLARDWTPAERSLVEESLAAYADHYRSNPDQAETLITVGEYPVDGSVPPVQLAAWTMLCNQLMNLDEVLNK